MTQFWDRQLDDHDNRRHNMEDAGRQSAQERTCPACGRESALKRTLDTDGSLNLVCQREQCGYRRVVPLEDLTDLFSPTSAAR